VLRGDLPRLSRATSIVTSAAMPATEDRQKTALWSIKRSKPLKYAYEKEIVLYAHHKRLDYFSTECIYSPEAFRGTARALIKDLERVRPSAILDIVRSGEDMARLCPGYEESSCGGTCTSNGVVAEKTGDEEDEVGGCGTSNGVAEMRRVDEALARKEHHLELDVDQNGSISTPSVAGTEKNDKKRRKSKKEPVKQTLGHCIRCGYMSSQSICKACTLLEGLNRNKPKREISVSSRPIEENQLDVNAVKQADGVNGITNGIATLNTVPG
jgi:cytoplasmic tRNA 2-thiolation protein 1